MGRGTDWVKADLDAQAEIYGHQYNVRRSEWPKTRFHIDNPSTGLPLALSNHATRYTAVSIQQNIVQLSQCVNDAKAKVDSKPPSSAIEVARWRKATDRRQFRLAVTLTGAGHEYNPTGKQHTSSNIWGDMPLTLSKHNPIHTRIAWKRHHWVCQSRLEHVKPVVSTSQSKSAKSAKYIYDKRRKRNTHLGTQPNPQLNLSTNYFHMDHPESLPYWVYSAVPETRAQRPRPLTCDIPPRSQSVSPTRSPSRPHSNPHLRSHNMHSPPRARTHSRGPSSRANPLRSVPPGPVPSNSHDVEAHVSEWAPKFRPSGMSTLSPKRQLSPTRLSGPTVGLEASDVYGDMIRKRQQNLETAMGLLAAEEQGNPGMLGLAGDINANPENFLKWRLRNREKPLPPPRPRPDPTSRPISLMEGHVPSAVPPPPHRLDPLRPTPAERSLLSSSGGDYGVADGQQQYHYQRQRSHADGDYELAGNMSTGAHAALHAADIAARVSAELGPSFDDDVSTGYQDGGSIACNPYSPYKDDVHRQPSPVGSLHPPRPGTGGSHSGRINIDENPPSGREPEGPLRAQNKRNSLPSAQDSQEAAPATNSQDYVASAEQGHVANAAQEHVGRRGSFLSGGTRSRRASLESLLSNPDPNVDVTEVTALLSSVLSDAVAESSAEELKARASLSRPPSHPHSNVGSRAGSPSRSLKVTPRGGVAGTSSHAQLPAAAAASREAVQRANNEIASSTVAAAAAALSAATENDSHAHLNSQTPPAEYSISAAASRSDVSVGPASPARSPPLDDATSQNSITVSTATMRTPHTRTPTGTAPATPASAAAATATATARSGTGGALTPEPPSSPACSTGRQSAKVVVADPVSPGVSDKTSAEVSASCMETTPSATPAPVPAQSSVADAGLEVPNPKD